MFLSLEFPGGDKGISIFVRALSGEKSCSPEDPYNRSLEGDRGKANCAIKECNKVAGALKKQGRSDKAFPGMFSQFDWPGTIGWEYWSSDYTLIFQHAVLVANTLGLPLHVHRNSMDLAIEAAANAGIAIEFKLAEPLSNSSPDDSSLEYINRVIREGRYFVLTRTVLPEGMPAAPRI